MKAILKIEVEIDDSFFYNEETKRLFYEADDESRETWLKEQAMGLLPEVIESEFKIVKLEL